MGILRKGILGGFSNKTGSLVGVKYKNLNIIRSLPLRSSKLPTQLQLDQRYKFGMVSSLLWEISELINPGFSARKEPSKPKQTAIAYHLKHAITGSSPSFIFDFTKLCFSKGNLQTPVHGAIEALAGLQVKFSWYKQERESYRSSPEDRCTVLVYNIAKHTFLYQVDAAKRKDGFYHLQCPASYFGDIVYAYMSFQSAHKERLHSSSVFLGQVLVL